MELFVVEHQFSLIHHIDIVISIVIKNYITIYGWIYITIEAKIQ